MATTQENNETQVFFSPQELSPEHLVVAYLVHKISNLPKEALGDLALLAPEVANCNDEETFREIAETIREILFPELIGGLREEAPRADETPSLKSRMEWIGKVIKEKRKEANLTQSELAGKSGLPQSHISRLEAGRHSPSHRTLQRIAEALGIAVRSLDPATDDPAAQ